MPWSSLISDNGPPFDSSEFRKFPKELDFEYYTSSPGNSKGNGKVESAVKTAKQLVHKDHDAGSDWGSDRYILDYPCYPWLPQHTYSRYEFKPCTATSESSNTDVWQDDGNEKEVKDLAKR